MAEVERTADGLEILRPEMNENGLYEIESLCMQCEDNGMTRILPIKIPYFKEVLLESFSCDHCGFKNNTIKSAGEIQPKACRYIFTLSAQEDFQRQVVRSDTGVFRIADIDLEMPPAPGQYTTLESLFNKVLTDLSHDQPLRKIQQPEVFEKLEPIIQRLTTMLEGGSFPIKIILEDISGNSFITPMTTDTVKNYRREDFHRTHSDNVQLGLATEGDNLAPTNGYAADQASFALDPMAGVDVVDSEVYALPTECPACSSQCVVNMKQVRIPHFKEVIVMATVCDACGYKTNEIKTGGAIPEKGRKITLVVKSVTDLSRDILKSETCELRSEDLGLEVQSGTLGGRFTTVEGLLSQVRDQLRGQIFDIEGTAHQTQDVETQNLQPGDSMDANTRSNWNKFFDKLDKALKAEFEFSITLIDPLGNSFVQKNVDGEQEDPQITAEEYTRTEEEEEELGISDMKVEGYGESEGDENDATHEEHKEGITSQTHNHVSYNRNVEEEEDEEDGMPSLEE